MSAFFSHTHLKFSHQDKLNTRQIPAILTFHALFGHLKVAAYFFLFIYNSPILYFSDGMKSTQVAEVRSSAFLFKLYLVKIDENITVPNGKRIGAYN